MEWNAECAKRNEMECGMEWNGMKWNARSGMREAECGMEWNEMKWNARSGMREAECAKRNAECGMIIICILFIHSYEYELKTCSRNCHHSPSVVCHF
jgi:hypothetical protein